MSKKHKNKDKNYSSNRDVNLDIVNIQEETITEVTENTIVYEDTKAKIYNSSVIQECRNDIIEPRGISAPAIFIIPVLFAKCDVNISLESIVEFSSPILEITQVDSKIILDKKDFLKGSCTLFLEGMVRQFIQYATIKSVGKKSVSGDIAYSVFYIPFKVFTKVNSSEEILKDKKVTCEVEFAKIMDTSIEEEKESLNNYFCDEYSFKKINEKIVASLRIKLFQDREVSIYEK